MEEKKIYNRPSREEIEAKRAIVKEKLKRFQTMKYDANEEKEKSLDKEQEKII
jgi:hypothetical protein